MSEAQGGAVLVTEAEPPYRVPGYLWRQVQNWLERYHEMLAFIDEAEAEAINGSARPPEGSVTPGRGSKTRSDPTGVRGARLADNWELGQCRVRVRAIRETLDGLEWAKRELVRVYYWEARQRTTWRAVAAVVGADERTCRRWRDGIVREIALRMPKGENRV